MEHENWTPVTHDSCEQVTGPFYHGTRNALAVGDELVAGYPSNFEEGRVSNHIYFSAKLEPAVWGAELACALSGHGGRGHIYLVEPTGSFEDDPNLTNKKFPGNPTQSFRTRASLRVVAEVTDWEGHSPEVIKNMLDGLAELHRTGRHIIYD